ncbi:MAG: RNA degradosome polyphosphate kinase, partial [Pseudomonadota bacterium]
MRADFLNTSVAPPDPSLIPTVDAETPGRFENREMSWLSFNWRVLEEADNPRQPLLERVRFLSISGSNLDEFYTVRVAGLRAQARGGIETRSVDGRTPLQQLEVIDRDAVALLQAQQKTWQALRAELAEANIFVVGQSDLTEEDKTRLEPHFLDQV